MRRLLGFTDGERAAFRWGVVIGQLLMIAVFAVGRALF